jgi:hypothetical protein
MYPGPKIQTHRPKLIERLRCRESVRLLSTNNHTAFPAPLDTSMTGGVEQKEKVQSSKLKREAALHEINRARARCAGSFGSRHKGQDKLIKPLFYR